MSHKKNKAITIILLRGLGRESAHWGDFPNRLRATLQNHFLATVRCIDLLGTGQFYREKVSSELHRIAEHARLNAINLSKNELLIEQSPLFLIGISMGAMVALDWAQNDINVKGLILINTSFGQQPLSWRVRPAAWSKALLALVVPIHCRERIMLSIVSNQDNGKSKELIHWQSIQQRRPVSRGNIIRMLIAAARYKPVARSDRLGLIVASEQDRLVSVKCSEQIAKQMQWPMITHPNAGHDLPMDAPDWLTRKIADWLIKNA